MCGTVDTLRWSSIFTEGDEKYEHYPIVKCQTENGTEIAITASEYHGFTPDFAMDDHLPFAVGDEIRVLYLRESPNDAKVDNVDEVWAWPIFLSKAGAGLMIIATMLRIAQARYRKKDNAETMDPWYHLHRAI